MRENCTYGGMGRGWWTGYDEARLHTRQRVVSADGAMMNLNTTAWLSLTVLAIVMGLLLFVPAWTMHYWQAWVYLSIFTGTSILTTLYLMRHDPALLARRLRGGPTEEQRPAQKLIMLFTSIGFIALLVISALDVRCGWSSVPLAGVVIGDVLVLTGFSLIILVYRENSFASATMVCCPWGAKTQRS